MRGQIFALAAVLPALVSAFHIPFSPPDIDGLNLDFAKGAFQYASGVASDAAHVAGDLLKDNIQNAQNVLSPASDMTLASIPGDDHIVFTSAMHPDKKVRIKSTTGWCDPGVRSYSGYFDVGGGRELFFYFFESRNDPKNDPVVMWINGGPGCSSSMGLFMELGPCTVNNNPKTVNDTKTNPYSWNERANIFFLDEPVEVGFSQSVNGQIVSNAEDAGRDVAAFVQMFFETFKEFEGREFHLSGESYGGRYLPVFAGHIYDGNKALKAAGKTPINLKSVLIGNGITSFPATTESYFPYLCQIQPGLNETVLDIKTCIGMADSLPRCHKMYKEWCLDTHDYTQCVIAETFCQATLSGAFFTAGRNPYDVSKSCSLEELTDSLCYPETKKIRTYLDLPDVRHTLGVTEGRHPFESCDNRVGFAFNEGLDNTAKTWFYVSELLERGIRILNYAGTLDFICNHVGNEVWMEALEWSGKKEYNKAELAEWNVNGKLAGYFKTHKNLSLLKVLGAGHMVPLDQPENSLSMLHDWLEAGKVGK